MKQTGAGQWYMRIQLYDRHGNTYGHSIFLNDKDTLEAKPMHSVLDQLSWWGWKKEMNLSDVDERTSMELFDFPKGGVVANFHYKKSTMGGKTFLFRNVYHVDTRFKPVEKDKKFEELDENFVAAKMERENERA